MKLAAAVPGLCLAMLGNDVSGEISVLDRERNDARLEAAAVAIANSGDAAGIEQLGVRLGKNSFLSRLDRADETERLGRVFEALAAHPSRSVENVCTRLAFDVQFTSVPVRVNYLLYALAAVRPTSQTAADVFRKTGRSGYLEVNGPLLAENGSPLALKVLEEFFSDPSLKRAQLVSMAHWALVPVRTHADIIAMCARLLTPGPLSDQVRTAVAESLFDYRAGEWFGVRRDAPRPGPWASADTHAKDLLRKLGATLLRREDLKAWLRAAIERTLASAAA